MGPPSPIPRDRDWDLSRLVRQSPGKLKTFPPAAENRKTDNQPIMSLRVIVSTAAVGRLLRDLAGRTAVPSIRHRLRERRHGGIVRTSPVNDRGQCMWRDERKWREKPDVPFYLAFTLRDLGERANAARCDIVDPGARLGDGEENRVPGFWFEGRLRLGLMQDAFDGRERRCAPW